ncbi:MAG TPA: SDR family oxidoreductase [Verrucomicrobiales bacterium]|nr:SDR family oxidoreductase [Verrucomicrobiales bacterium]
MGQVSSNPLHRKVIVIIGGTQGIGLSAAKAVISAGAKVICVGRNPDNASKARETLKDKGEVLIGDASDSETAGKAIQAAIEKFGGFHGLYHVAGGSGRRWGDGPLHEISLEGWDKTLALNLNAVFYSNRAAIRQFLKQESGGAVLNMSSVLGFSPSERHFSTHAYATTKAAIIGLTRSAAASYAKNNVRFNVLAPALVDTPMARRAIADDAIQSFVQSKQPLDGGFKLSRS